MQINVSISVRAVWYVSELIRRASGEASSTIFSCCGNFFTIITINHYIDRRLARRGQLTSTTMLDDTRVQKLT